VGKLIRHNRVKIGIMALLSSLGAASLSHASEPPRPAPLHYIGSVQLDPDAGWIGAGWTILIKDPALDHIDFSLTSAFGTAVVAGSGVKAMRSEIDPNSYGGARIYRVDLMPAEGGRPRRVKFAYAGPLFPEELLLPINSLDTDKIELTVDSDWFPFDARFDTKLTAQVNVRIDGDWTAIGLGNAERVQGGYRFTQEAPALDIALALLSRSVVVKTDNYVIYDARPEPGTKVDELSDALAVCTTYLNGVAGPVGPLPPASIIITGRPEGSYARGTLIALTDIENEDEESLRQFTCHELAHHWSHANPGGPDNWINEGFADHLGNMAVRDMLGRDVFEARMARYAEQLTEAGTEPIWTQGTTDRPTYLTLYRAAPMALRDLEAKMGEADFAALMQQVMAGSVRTTPELMAMIEQLAGADMRDWFEVRLGA